jgi:hypothetical protein
VTLVGRLCFYNDVLGEQHLSRLRGRLRCPLAGEHAQRIPFSITKQHTVFPKSDAFKADLDEFVAVCRVVDGMRRARLGAVGARPNAFNTTLYSEKLLHAFGISVRRSQYYVVCDFARLPEIPGRRTGTDIVRKGR